MVNIVFTLIEKKILVKNWFHLRAPAGELGKKQADSSWLPVTAV